MKNYQIFFLLFIFFTGFGQDINPIKYDSIYSKELGYSRKIKIYVPEKFEIQSGGKFNVVYLLDGQSEKLFDLVIADFNYLNLNQISGIPPFIIVAIETGGKLRWKEFTPDTKDEKTIKKYQPDYGDADKYLKFLKLELFPYIENHYNVTKHRIGIGHSLGGTCLMNIMNKDNSLFNAYFLFSPNLDYGNGQLVDEFDRTYQKQAALNKFLYVSVSDQGDRLDKLFKHTIKRLDSIIENKKIAGLKNKFDYLSGYDHSQTPVISLPTAINEYSKLYAYPTDSILDAYLSEKNQFLSNLKKFYKSKSKYLGYDYRPTVDVINVKYAYYAFEKDKTDDALDVINWAIECYPDNYNLYDSKAEFLEKKGDLKQAVLNYGKGLEILERLRSKMFPSDYEDDKEIISGHLKNVQKNNRP